MSTHDLYTRPVEVPDWNVQQSGAARFTWEYDDGRDRLLALYQKGKERPSAGRRSEVDAVIATEAAES